jgi:phosphoglycolate phosphatase
MHLAEIHPVRSLLFDLDGTLVDSCPGIAASLSTAFRAAGRIMPPGDLRDAIGPPIRIMAARIDPTLTEPDLDQIEKTFRADYDSHGWQKTVLFEGVVPGLQRLRSNGAQLFLVTNKPRIPTVRILTHFGMMDLFEEIVTRDSRTPSYSGKSAMLSDLLRRHRLPTESTIMVGDTAEDGEAAADNRLEFIHASYGYGSVSVSCRSITCFSELWTALSVKKTAEKV